MYAVRNCDDAICPPQGAGLHLRFGKQPTSILGGLKLATSSQERVSSHRTQDALNVYGLGEIVQGFTAEALHRIALAQAADGLGTDQELTGLGRGGQTRR